MSPNIIFHICLAQEQGFSLAWRCPRLPRAATAAQHACRAPGGWSPIRVVGAMVCCNLEHQMQEDEWAEYQETEFAKILAFERNQEEMRAVLTRRWLFRILTDTTFRRDARKKAASKPSWGKNKKLHSWLVNAVRRSNEDKSGRR